MRPPAHLIFAPSTQTSCFADIQTNSQLDSNATEPQNTALNLSSDLIFAPSTHTTCSADIQTTSQLATHITETQDPVLNNSINVSASPIFAPSTQAIGSADIQTMTSQFESHPTQLQDPVPYNSINISASPIFVPSTQAIGSADIQTMTSQFESHPTTSQAPALSNSIHFSNNPVVTPSTHTSSSTNMLPISQLDSMTTAHTSPQAIESQLAPAINPAAPLSGSAFDLQSLGTIVQSKYSGILVDFYPSTRMGAHLQLRIARFQHDHAHFAHIEVQVQIDDDGFYIIRFAPHALVVEQTVASMHELCSMVDMFCTAPICKANTESELIANSIGLDNAITTTLGVRHRQCVVFTAQPNQRCSYCKSLRGTIGRRIKRAEQPVSRTQSDVNSHIPFAKLSREALEERCRNLARYKLALEKQIERLCNRNPDTNIEAGDDFDYENVVELLKEAGVWKSESEEEEEEEEDRGDREAKRRRKARFIFDVMNYKK
eukprot:TRINITY_DN4173_c0_g1_i1.p1 TRINITY_DN4173_c0_g1~~TRINITY_DN4173_c0_g1_i1.p1  ORF type:complete len:489 (+),score=46.30 TRINITY_DN4173_c0_g1_i1:417-1883(+)